MDPDEVRPLIKHPCEFAAYCRHAHLRLTKLDQFTTIVAMFIAETVIADGKLVRDGVVGVAASCSPTTTMAGPGYNYPVANTTLHSALKLQEHTEGGYYAVTHISAHTIPVTSIETADDRKSEITIPATKDARRLLGTTIYYLLDPASPRGYLHMNKSTTMHFHHAGRARYTLIRPAPSGGAPDISHATIGESPEAGEVRQLLVEGGVWKCSEIPPEDLAGLAEEGLSAADMVERREKIGCLISELVFPGFEWEDHAFLTMSTLRDLFKTSESSEDWKKFQEYVRPDER